MQRFLTRSSFLRSLSASSYSLVHNSLRLALFSSMSSIISAILAMSLVVSNSNALYASPILPADVAEAIRGGIALTAGGERGVLTLAIGYGGRQEIVSAVNAAVRRGKEVTEEEFNSLLWTGNMPPPDLIIRTGREKRISNFLLWQCAYAEFYFTDILFPDFSDGDFDDALKAYAARDRRFGKV